MLMMIPSTPIISHPKNKILVARTHVERRGRCRFLDSVGKPVDDGLSHVIREFDLAYA